LTEHYETKTKSLVIFLVISVTNNVRQVDILQPTISLQSRITTETRLSSVYHTYVPRGKK